MKRESNHHISPTDLHTREIKRFRRDALNGQFPAIFVIAMLPDVMVMTIALYGLLRESSRYFMFARLAEDTPTSNIQSAAQGYRELKGTIAGLFPEHLISPLTHNECLWYRYKVEVYMGGRRDSWQVVDEGESDQVFLIRDETGRCIVDPTGANITTRLEHRWYGATPKPTMPPPSKNPAIVRLDKSHRYRYHEERIEAGEQLYLFGDFSSYNEVPEQIAKRSTEQIISFREEDKKQLHQAFDENKDSVIDYSEWQKAGEMAHDVATKEMRPIAWSEQVNLISRPTIESHPYLLSTRSEFDMVTHYRKRMLLYLAGFAAALLYGAFQIHNFPFF